MDGRGRPRHPETLTPRQQEVLELIRDGLTNRQIARQLGISFDAAKYHVSEIISRTGSTTRHEAARWREDQPERATASLGTWRQRRRHGRPGHSRGRLSHTCGAGVPVLLNGREAA